MKFCPNCDAKLKKGDFGLQCPRCDYVEGKETKQTETNVHADQEKNTWQTKSDFGINDNDKFLEAILDGHGNQWYIIKYDKIESPDPEKIQITSFRNKITDKILNGLPTYGITSFLPFQANAINEILLGKDIIISAPTGSGKSEAFIIPILNKIISENIKNTVYVLLIYPTTALVDDQTQKITKILESCKLDWIKLGKYHSGISSDAKKNLTENPPQILATTFDSINNQMSMQTKNWEKLFANAKVIVIDEAHSYSSYFGTHIHYVIKRMKQKMGKIQFIGCSATLDNAEEFFKTLLGIEHLPTLIKTEVGRKRTMHRLFVMPKNTSNLTTCSNLTVILSRFKHKSLVFSNSHNDTETIAKDATEKKISIEVHKGNLTSEQKQRVERLMKDGILDAISCTSTLELGIDIGHVNAVVSAFTNDLDNFQQRIGRAGRAEQTSYSVCVMDPDNPICHYYIKHIQDYLNQKNIVEINPDNPIIKKAHEEFAKLENKCMEPKNRMRKLELFDALEIKSLRGDEGNVQVFKDRKHMFQRNIPIAYYQLHKNAICHHNKKTYRVSSLQNINGKKEAELVFASKEDEFRVTSPNVFKNVIINEEISQKRIKKINLQYCVLKISRTIDAYYERNTNQQRSEAKKIELSNHDQFSWKTTNLGLGISFPHITTLSKESELIHTIIHLLVNASKIFTKCADNDIEAHVSENNEIFLYDNTADGANGFSLLIYEHIEEIIEIAKIMINQCDCNEPEGCVKCTFTTSHCEKNNKELDKMATRDFFNTL